MKETPLRPSRAELEDLFRIKYGDPDQTGWSPRMRWNRAYFNPDDQYEALVAKLVGKDTDWMDAGCGRFLFPFNEKLSRMLADRANRLVGVDPDETIHENPYVHEKAQALIGDFKTDEPFDLVTLRMVAEHVEDPQSTVRQLAKLLKPGGRVVIYTVFKWSPGAVLADLVPHRLHHGIKRVLWRTETKDTFPVQNKMNTRGRLKKLFAAEGMNEIHFAYLDDCRTFTRFRVLYWIELTTMRVLRFFRLHYPELCIVGVYEKGGDKA